MMNNYRDLSQDYKRNNKNTMENNSSGSYQRKNGNNERTKKDRDSNILKEYVPLDKDYVSRAEEIIRNFNAKENISTNKIRMILTMIGELQKSVSQIKGDILDDKFISSLKYYKMRCAYEAGRDKDVKNFMEKTQLIALVDWIGDSKGNFKLYFHYVEALVAFHRYYNGNK